MRLRQYAALLTPAPYRTPILFNIIYYCLAQVLIAPFWCAPEPKTQHQGHPDED